MKKTQFLYTGIALFAFMIFAATKMSSPNDGFVKLFNGKNFDGWSLQLRSGDAELAKKVFAIDKKGIIHVFKNFPDSFGTKVNRSATHGMIWTNKKYSQYIFKFDYKWGKKVFNNYNQFQYDAGFYYHVNEKKIWPDGVEYQVRYDDGKNKNHTGDYWASGNDTRFDWTMKNGQFALPKDGGTAIARKGGEHLAADAPYHALDDQWNTCEVIVMGDKYSIHKLNGKVVNYATNLTLKEGYLGLQSETAEIYYKNIMIKELKDFVPAEEFLR